MVPWDVLVLCFSSLDPEYSSVYKQNFVTFSINFVREAKVLQKFLALTSKFLDATMSQPKISYQNVFSSLYSELSVGAFLQQQQVWSDLTSSEVVFPQFELPGCQPSSESASNSCTHLDRNTHGRHGCVHSENPCRTVVSLWLQTQSFLSRTRSNTLTSWPPAP